MRMMHAAKGAVRQAIKAGASVVDRVRKPGSGVVVLAYHRVGGGSELELDLDPGLFRQQMAWLQQDKSAVSLDEGMQLVEKSNGPQATVVTFDDGTTDFMEHALPALVEHNIPATYYIATEFIDTQKPFPNEGQPLSWKALAEAVSTGLVTVASHTHSHAVMDKLTMIEAEAELRISAELIEDKLGIDVAHFAYPKGVFGGVAIERAIAERYTTAALVGGGPNPFAGTDNLRLNRAPIQRSDGMRYFERKVRGGLQIEDAMRNIINRRRYQHVTN